MAKSQIPQRSSTEIRGLILGYFYERNQNATSAMGKKGSAIKISDVKAELKAKHDLTQQEVQSNLTYLISQHWVEEKVIKKEVQGKGGTTFPSTTTFYQISAAGIDKIDGPGEYTMKKFHDIKIEATGQNIITVGDGNEISAKHQGLGEALADLRKAITESNTSETEKLEFAADIDTIQSQLAKPEPNKTIVTAAWESVKAAAAINGCSSLVTNVGVLIAGFLS